MVYIIRPCECVNFIADGFEPSFSRILRLANRNSPPQLYEKFKMFYVNLQANYKLTDRVLN
jgi:hypothetical protein